MPEYVIELYIPRSDAGTAGRSAIEAERGAEQLSREGKPVRFVRSIFVPEDETCFLLYEAASAGLVDAAARRAALPFDRVTEVVAAP